jgi:hypothetical protein
VSPTVADPSYAATQNLCHGGFAGARLFGTGAVHAALRNPQAARRFA